jgi:hypothetical protein
VVVLVLQLREGLEVVVQLVVCRRLTLEQTHQGLLVVQVHLGKATPVELEALPVEQ